MSKETSLKKFFLKCEKCLKNTINEKCFPMTKVYTLSLLNLQHNAPLSSLHLFFDQFLVHNVGDRK